MPPKAKADPKAKAKADDKPKAPKKTKEEKEAEEENKIQPPDRTEFEASMEKIQETIAGFQNEQVALAKQIGERGGGKEAYFAKRAEYRAQLDEFTAKIDALMARKEEFNKAMGDKRAEGTEMRAQLTKMKKSIGYTSEGDIDDRIASIEFKLWTDTISLKQEKDYLKEISELKRNRPKVGQVTKMEEGLSSRDSGSNIKENIGVVNEEMSLYRDGKRQVSAKLKELNEGRQEQLGDLPDLIAQREALQAKIQEQIQLKNTARDEFRQQERDFNQQKNEQRRARQDKIFEEKAANQAQWVKQQRMKKAEALDEQPYVSEMTLVEQTILFCKSLVADTGPVKQEEKKEVVHNNPEGTEVMMRKEDREEEFYYAPTATKKKSKSARNKTVKEGSNKPIRHNAETFKLFDKLKLNAPITTEDIPATLEKLEAQLKDYKEKVAAWETNKEELKNKILAGEDVSAKEEKEEKEEKKEEEGEQKDDE